VRRKPLSLKSRRGRALAKEQLEVLYPGALPTRLELQSGAGAQQVRVRVRVRVTLTLTLTRTLTLTLT